MIIRYFLVTLGLFLGLTACSGGKDTGTTGDDDDDDNNVGDDDDDDDDDDSGLDSGQTPGDQYFDVTYFMVDATFAYDSTTGAVVTATSPYGELPSYIGLYMGEAAWEAAGFAFDSDAYCAIILPLTATAQAAWPAGVGMWYGFDYNVADAPGTSCNTPGYELDPELWGTQIEVDLATYYGWGVGVGPLKEDYIEDYVGEDIETQILGAYVNNTMLPPPEGVEGYVSLAFEMNAAYEVTVDNEGLLVALEADTINLGGNIATAYYRVYSRLIWTFQ
jgi:hypothetical protein